MKCKLQTLLLAVLLLQAGCGQKREATGESRRIMVTIEALRYFADRLAGSGYTIESLVPEGTNPETYDPTPAQIARLSEADIYFKVGRLGTEEMWKKSITEVMEGQIVDTSEGLGYDTTADNNPEHRHTGSHYHHGAGDPHTWSSVEGARVIAANMKKALVAVYPADSALFECNYAALSQTIDSVETILNTLLVPLKQRAFMTYHPSLTYFSREFGLEQLPIESEGKEPSPTQLKALIDKARSEGVRVIFIQREFDRRQAEAIAAEAGCKVAEIAPAAYNWPETMVHVARCLAE